MTASLHKLSAGAGYDYLTRSVCCDDATGRSGQGLASYYSEKGDIPGRFIGSGIAGIDGIEVGDTVLPDHMKALFGVGMHPLAIERNRAFDATPLGQGPSAQERRDATHLGRPYPVYDSAPAAFAIEMNRRIRVYNRLQSVHRDDKIPADVRAQLRTELAREFFVREHGREPESTELAATVAKNTRPGSNAVSGFDLTFSPVKSVSTLWALAGPELAAQIERAHNESVAESLAWLEGHALFTREGSGGVRQVDVKGLVATAFVHRDSRAGDPDLHTHVAIANKVQTLRGRWLSIDGRLLYKALVSVSETYNTALEKHLHELLGVRFVERPNADARKRAVREIDGVNPELNQRFSKRRAMIEHRRDQLAHIFQEDHGRPPTPTEAIELAQQATLETREAKHEPRAITEQRAAWKAEAAEVLGSEAAITDMLNTALTPTARPAVVPDKEWVAATAREVAKTLQSRRAVWQVWHVYAEAQRRVRLTDVPAGRTEKLANALVNTVLAQHSVILKRPADPVREPDELRRADGSSVYQVAGSQLFTSTATLQAEARLVAAAGRRDGKALSEETVGVALLECTANGMRLNPGQSTLVREMATSGARVQLAIAPAGSGKTTAMRALAAAWEHGGGTVIGLAPSAVAATELGRQIDGGTARSDTLAKLVHGITSGRLPHWAETVDANTLLVVDEAGMADTISLDTAVAFALSRGASVRLIGDDQQLAAIGAGGVLRDIKANHGAIHLTEIMRFRSPAEASASLALRQGRPEALGFYLDHQRVHIGDQTAMTDRVFNAWLKDRDAGLESLMLAPTRDLVADLNQRARAHRVTHDPQPDRGSDGATVRLADGNLASVGDVVITRTNDRRLKISASDWVKNGDRWVITAITAQGVRVQHRGSNRAVHLPSEYVANSTDLGYACTVHTAQGVTSDTTHGLVTGEESRQQLYTMATRGRDANHLYLAVTSDGDPHNLIHPDVLHPRTATEILESILARDIAPKSATTLQREPFEARQRLAEATARYADALTFAAESTLGTSRVEHIEERAEQLVPSVTQAGAWPALRSHLLLVAASGRDPLTALASAVNESEVSSARDVAAILDSRLETDQPHPRARGPLPWLTAIPATLVVDPMWGPYLTARSKLVESLASEVRDAARAATLAPAWLRSGATLSPAAIADIEVWRAATGVSADDLRPTGPAAAQNDARQWQRRLNRAALGPHSPALREWGDALASIDPRIGRDDFCPVLVERLAAMSRAGLNPNQLLGNAAQQGHLPADHPAAALWWRISAKASPAVAARIDEHEHLTDSAVASQLDDLLGTDTANRLRASSWWPALLTVVDQGLRRGWQLPHLLETDSPTSDSSYVDLCQALVWRASVALSDIPSIELPIPEEVEAPPEDLDAVWQAPTDWRIPSTQPVDEPDPAPTSKPVIFTTDQRLLVATLMREQRGIEPERLCSDTDLRRAFLRANAWDQTAVSRERMLEINTLTQAFFTGCYGGSWSQSNVRERFGYDLAGHEIFAPGYAPFGWTHLIEELHGHGVTEAEMRAVGVATLTRDGRAIDKFRGRLTFPIRSENGEILGFVARRHPRLNDATPHAGAKYLNTADTPLFHKGAQLFGLDADLIAAGATPVLVEGPTDAIAVTLASAGLYLGVAPLGTALTDDQAIQLARIFQHTGRDPIVATDADPAGRTAAQRDFWKLTAVGLEPRFVALRDGDDPASLLTNHGPAALAGALRRHIPLVDVVLKTLLDSAEASSTEGVFTVLAAAGPATWDDRLSAVAASLNLREQEAKTRLLTAVGEWDRDPRGVAEMAATTSTQRPHGQQRWLRLAQTVDPRLPREGDWVALTQMLERAHRAGHDVVALVEDLTRTRPLNQRPAQDLRYRLVGAVGADAMGGHEPTAAPAAQGLQSPSSSKRRSVDRTPDRSGPAR